jgi:hypothetical protein
MARESGELHVYVYNDDEFVGWGSTRELEETYLSLLCV